MKGYLYLIFLLFAITTIAQETIKTMFYNLLEFPEASPVNRELILRNILNEYDSDIFMVCELLSVEGADLILDLTLNSEGEQYARAPFVPNQSGSADLQQMIFYKSNKFNLETSAIITTAVRDINRYLLKLKTTDQEIDSVYLDIYVTHLKSSQGSENQNLRLDMVHEFTTALESIDPNSFVIFTGDFNLYSSTEPAYIELLDQTNAIVMVDPIHTLGAWNNNENFQAIHTQSTRISSWPFGAGAGGGLDDRFDFITISENMENDNKMLYVQDSYKSFGNNANCFNLNVNDANCTGVYSQELRDNLYNMSDHLPVVMQLETNKEFILSSPDFTTTNLITIQNTLVQNFITITISEEYTKPVTFSIYNTLGQKVLQYKSENKKNNTIDVSFLDAGLFYIKTNITNSKPLKFLKTY